MKYLNMLVVCALVGLTGLFTMGCEQVDASLAYIGLNDNRDPAWVKTSDAYEEAADAVTTASDSAMDVQISIGETRKTLEELQAKYQINSDALAVAVAEENAAWTANIVETDRIIQEHVDQLNDTNTLIKVTDSEVTTTTSEFSARATKRVTEQ